MRGNIFYILDVFTEKKYAGNQLTVIRVGEKLSCTEMQKIAKEMNFSETTFILSDKMVRGGYNVRIFTPEKEVQFAGHPTLGTAYVIWKEIIGKPVKTVVLNLKIGQIPVELAYKGRTVKRLIMKQKEPVFGTTFHKENVSEVLGLDGSEIDHGFPIQEVSTGLPFIIIPLKTLAAVKKAKVNREKYFQLIENTDAKAIFIFCSETHKKENHLYARMFAPYYGIVEDPATGSANGCLAGYLVKHRYFGKDHIKDHINVRVEQGYEIGRPSLLFLEAKQTGDKIEVYVGGKVIETARGNFV